MKNLLETNNEGVLASPNQPVKVGGTMFKPLFQTMHEALDQMTNLMTGPATEDQQRWLSSWFSLRQLSDECIEEWLRFEDKMSATYKLFEVEYCDNALTPEGNLHYQRGEGYFKLFMFQEAYHQFSAILDAFPNYTPARLYSALCLMQIGESRQAQD
jgi:hypothetical protein